MVSLRCPHWIDLYRRVPRRRAVRLECSRTSTCRVQTLSFSRKGIVKDISPIGISLIVHAALRTGMFLDVSLLGDDEKSFSQPLLARVRHVTPQDDGTWLVGCSSVKKLSKQELSDWL